MTKAPKTATGLSSKDVQNADSDHKTEEVKQEEKGFDAENATEEERVAHEEMMNKERDKLRKQQQKRDQEAAEAATESAEEEKKFREAELSDFNADDRLLRVLLDKGVISWKDIEAIHG